MLLNKSLIQALKNAFPSCAGLYDDDDASAMASAGAMSAAASPAPSVPAMDRTALDKKLAQVVRLAKARNAWDIATDWAADNCAGDDLKYALAFITKARTEEVEEAKVVQPKQIEVKEPAKPVVKPTYAAPRQFRLRRKQRQRLRLKKCRIIRTIPWTIARSRSLLSIMETTVPQGAVVSKGDTNDSLSQS